MDEKEYYKKRMFCIVDDNLYLAPEKDRRIHRERMIQKACLVISKMMLEGVFMKIDYIFIKMKIGEWILQSKRYFFGVYGKL